MIIALIQETKDIRAYIGGVHLWGKGLSNGKRIAHYGKFNTYFFGDTKLKQEFLIGLGDLFDDNITRKLVLEVNSGNDDMISIIEDLNTVGFKYI